jgi:hypothetical protein
VSGVAAGWGLMTRNSVDISLHVMGAIAVFIGNGTLAPQTWLLPALLEPALR